MSAGHGEHPRHCRRVQKLRAVTLDEADGAAGAEQTGLNGESAVHEQPAVAGQLAAPAAGQSLLQLGAVQLHPGPALFGEADGMEGVAFGSHVEERALGEPVSGEPLRWE